MLQGFVGQTPGLRGSPGPALRPKKPGFLMVTDSTNGRTTEELRSYLAAIVDSSDDAIIGTRLDGVIETWNSAAEKLYGYAAPEAVGRHIRLLESPEQPGEISGILKKTARGETVSHHQTVRLTKDGRRIGVSVTISPIRDAGGRVVGASAIARDIGERAALENALRISEERYRSLALASAQIVWTKNAQGEVVEDWPMWRAFTGQRADEITGQGWASAVHPEDRARISRVFANALQNRIVYETEYRLRRSGGGGGSDYAGQDPAHHHPGLERGHQAHARGHGGGGGQAAA